MNNPKHVAIIMDGNGRWANARKHNRVFGHIRGAKVAYKIIKHCSQKNLKFLTLFAFSTENWSRPQLEVSLLMSLLIKNLKREKNTLVKNNIKFQAIGNLSELPIPVQKLITETTEATKNNTGLCLSFALNYGGQQEILEAVKIIVQKNQDGSVQLKDLTAKEFAKHLPSSFLPPPDLIIRTSNEQRLSNFFLWQAAYSEFYFTQLLWPDFTTNEFDQAINSYLLRKRRFGNIATETEATPPLDYHG